MHIGDRLTENARSNIWESLASWRALLPTRANVLSRPVGVWMV
jgi:hypothetical protein